MKKVITLLLLVLSIGAVKAQSTELSKYKSLFTLNFIRYFDWQDNNEGDFVIGVLKNSGIAKQLSVQVTGKKVGYKNIVVKEFKRIDDITDCNIIYVGESVNYSKYSAVISEKLSRANPLIITEGNGTIPKGAMINFVIVNDKLKFEISSENAVRGGLKFSNSLLLLNNAIRA